MCSLHGGKITLIRDDGTLGLYFIPHCNRIKIGSSIQCDIRIQNDSIRKVHCMIYPDPKNNVIQIKNFSKKNPLRLNGVIIKKCHVLNHRDIISVCQKQFLWTYVPPKFTKRLSSGVGEEGIVDLDDDEVPQTDDGDGTSLDKTLVKSENHVKKVNRRFTCKINKIPIGNIAKRLKAQKRITIHEFGNVSKLDDSWAEQEEDNCEEYTYNTESDNNPENTIMPTIGITEYVDTNETSLEKDVENENVTVSRSTVKNNNTTPLKDITKLQETNIMITPRTNPMLPLEASTPFQRYENKNLSVKLSKLEKSDSLVWSVSPATLSHRSKNFAKSFTNTTMVNDLIDVDTPENTIIKKTVSSLVYLIDLTTPNTSNTYVQDTPNKSAKLTTLLKSAIKNSSNVSKTPKTGLHATANTTINKFDRTPIVAASSVKKVLNMTNTLSTPVAQNRKSLFLNKTVTPHCAMLSEPQRSANLSFNDRKTFNMPNISHRNDEGEMDKSSFMTVGVTPNTTLRKTMAHTTPAKTPVKDRVATPGRAKLVYAETKFVSEVKNCPLQSHRIENNLPEVTNSCNTPAKGVLSNIPSVLNRFETSGKCVTSNELTEVDQLMRTPDRSLGIKELANTSARDTTKDDLSNVTSDLNEFDATGKCVQSNDLIEDISVKEVTITPVDLRNVQGSKELIPDKQLPINDLTDVTDVKEFLNTSAHDLQDVRGVKQLMKTPDKHNQTNDLVGVRELLNTPARDDLRDVRGVKELMKTPGKHIPINDLTDVAGVRELLNTPARDDLRDVRGVKELMKTPGQHLPTNDLTNVVGVRELLNTPARDDLCDVRGIKELFNTPYEGHNPDFTINFDTITKMINSSYDFECDSKNVSVCTLPSIDIAPDSINVDDFDVADDRDDDTEFNEDFVSETKTMDETFDELIGKKHVTKTYSRKKSFEMRNNLTESQAENIEKWIDSVAVTPKPNNNQQILSNRYSNVTPQASVVEPPDCNHVDNDIDNDDSDSQSSHGSDVEAEFKRISISDPVDHRVSFRYENYDLSFRSESERSGTIKIPEVLDESALLNEEASDIIPSTQVETPRRYTRTQRESSLNIGDNTSKDTFVIEDEEAIIPETQFEVFQGDADDDLNDCDLHMSSQVLETNISLVLNGEEEILSGLVNNDEDDNSGETYIVEIQMQNEEPEIVAEEKDDSSILYIDDTIFMEKNTVAQTEIEFGKKSDDSSIILCDADAINANPLNLLRTRSKSETPEKAIQGISKAIRKTIGDTLNEKVSKFQQEIEKSPPCDDNFGEVKELPKKSKSISPQKLPLKSPRIKKKSIAMIDLSESFNECSSEESENLDEIPSAAYELNSSRKSIDPTPNSSDMQNKLAITTIDLSESLDESAKMCINVDKDHEPECELTEAEPSKLSKFEEEVKQCLPNILENIELVSIPRIKSKSISPKKQTPKLSAIKNKSIATIDLSESVNGSSNDSIEIDEASLGEFGANMESEISGIEPLQIEEPSRELAYDNSDDEMIDGVFENLEKDTSVNANSPDLTNKSASQLMVEECLEMDSDVFENFDENEIVQQTRATSLGPENVVKSNKVSRKTLGDQSDMKEITIDSYKAKSDIDCASKISSTTDPGIISSVIISCEQIAVTSSISIAETSNENIIDETESQSPKVAMDISSSTDQNVSSMLPEDSEFEGMQVRPIRSKSETPKKIIREACSSRRTMGDPSNQIPDQISQIQQEFEHISSNVKNQVSSTKLSLSDVDASSNVNDGSACILIYTDSEDEMIDSVFDNLQKDSPTKVKDPESDIKAGSQSTAEESSELDSEIFKNFNENEVVRRASGRTSLTPIRPVKSSSSKSSRKTMGDKLDMKEEKISKFASEVKDINLSLGDADHVPLQARRRAMSIGNKAKSPSEICQNKTVCEINYEEPIVEVSTRSEIEHSVQKIDVNHDISHKSTEPEKVVITVADISANAEDNLDDTFEHDESENLFNDEESELIVPETQEIPVESELTKNTESVLIIPETQSDDSVFENGTSQPEKLIHNRSSQLHKLSLNSPSRTKSPKHSMKLPSPPGKEWPKILIEKNDEVAKAAEDLKGVEIDDVQEIENVEVIGQVTVVENSEVVENVKTTDVIANLIPATRKRRLYSKETYTPLFEEPDDSVVNFQNNPTSTPFSNIRANLGELNISENVISSSIPAAKRALHNELLFLKVPETTADVKLECGRTIQAENEGERSSVEMEYVQGKSVNVEIKVLLNEEVTPPESVKTTEVENKKDYSVESESEVTTSTHENIASGKKEMVIKNIDDDNLKIARRVAFAEKPEEKYFEVLSEYEDSLIKLGRGRRLVRNKPAPKEEPVIKKPSGRAARQQRAKGKVQNIEDGSSLSMAETSVPSESKVQVIEEKTNRGRGKRVATVQQSDETSEVADTPNVDVPPTNVTENLEPKNIEKVTKTFGRNKDRQAQNTGINLTNEVNIEETENILVDAEHTKTINEEISEQEITTRNKGRRPFVKEMEVEEVNSADKQVAAADEEALKSRGRNRRRLAKETVKEVSKLVEPSVISAVEIKEPVIEKIIEPKASGRSKSRPPVKEAAPDETNESENLDPTNDEVFEPKKSGQGKSRRLPAKKKQVEETIPVEKATNRVEPAGEELVEQKVSGRGKIHRRSAKKLEIVVVEVDEKQPLIEDKKANVPEHVDPADVEILEQKKSVRSRNRQASTKKSHVDETGTVEQNEELAEQKRSGRGKNRQPSTKKSHVDEETDHVEQNEEEIIERKKSDRGKNGRQPAKMEKVASSVEGEASVEDKLSNNSEHLNALHEETVEPLKTDRIRSRRPLAKKNTAEVINENNIDEPATILETVSALEPNVIVQTSDCEIVEINTTGRGKGRRAPVRKKDAQVEGELKTKEIEENVPTSSSEEITDKKTTGRGRGRRAPVKKTTDVVIPSADEEPKLEEPAEKITSRGRGRRAAGTKKNNAVTSTAVKPELKKVLTVDISLDSTTPEKTDNSEVKIVSSTKTARGKIRDAPSIPAITTEVFATPTRTAVRGRRPAKKDAIILVTDSESEQVSESPAINRRCRPIKKPNRYLDSTASDADASSNEYEDKTLAKSSRGRKLVVTKPPNPDTPLKSRGGRGARKQSENESVADISSKEVSKITSHDETPSKLSANMNNKEMAAEKDNTTAMRGRGRRAKLDTNISVESVTEETPGKTRGRRAAELPAEKPIVPAKRGRKAKNELPDTDLLDAGSTESFQEPTPISTKPRSRRNEIAAAENIEKPSSSSKLKRKAKETPNDEESKNADVAKVSRVTRTRAK